MNILLKLRFVKRIYTKLANPPKICYTHFTILTR